MRLFATVLLLTSAMAAQVSPPRHESRWHHLFVTHREADNLEERYKKLRCALVLIQSGNTVGTGFYISPDGEIVTASHVLGNRQFTPLPNGTFNVTLLYPDSFLIKGAGGEKNIPAQTALDVNGDNWASDLAILRTHAQTACWLSIGNDHTAQPGQHLVTLGFPGLAFGSLSIYTGILSAKLKSELVIGMTTTGQPLKSTGEFLRVQMPISPGISGAPIIDDENRVIGVVTSAGAWGQDLEILTQIQHMRETAPAQNQTNSLDFYLLGVTAHLAEIYHDFGSPGYGDAVPLSYLKRTAQPQNQKPSQSGH